MSYDTYLTNQTNRHLDEQSRPNTGICAWCGSEQYSEKMIDKHLESFCSEDCVERWEQDVGINEEQGKIL